MFIRRGSAILRSPEGDNSGGGGGEPAPAFTEDQLKAIGTVVNQAITTHAKRKPEKSLADELKAVDWKAIVTPVLEGWATEKKLVGSDTPPADHSKPDPKVAALEAKLQALETKSREDAEKLARAQSEARDKDAMAALRSALGQHVRADALDIAARDLFHAQKRVTFDEQGNPLFTVKRAAYAGGTEEDTPMPLADGVQHWLKSSEAKFFLPPPGGSGAPPGGAPSARRVAAGADGLPVYDKPATTDAEKVRRAAEQAQALAAKYPHLAGT